MHGRRVGQKRWGWLRWLGLRGWLACGLLAAWAVAAQGRVIHVPADYTKIQDAVENTNEGDEVVVEPGIYEVFIIPPIDITVRSTFNGDWSIVRQTIIEGGVGISDVDHKQTKNCILRGFTIRPSYGSLTGIDGGQPDGSSTHATIEYNIISGFTNRSGIFQGAGIVNCDGLIQNNIIENNISFMGVGVYNCNGIIQNNVICHNRAEASFDLYSGLRSGVAAAMGRCNGTIRNNTIVDNYEEIVDKQYWSAGGLGGCKGLIVNNIIFHTTMTMPASLNNCTSPTYCLFRTPRSGVGNVAGDPHFADATGGDYRLLPGSPAIDAGLTSGTLLADFDGVRRGSGAGMDIGAFEAPARPVAVWLPGGAMPWLRSGDALPVSWALAAPADTSVRLRLYYAGGRFYYDLGHYLPLTASAFPIQLPPYLDTRTDYTIQAISIANGGGVSYSAETPPFAITGTPKNAVAGRAWLGYYTGLRNGVTLVVVP